jgi:hypothetical protein
MISHCARLSHPPTHWHAETWHLPRRGPLSFKTFSLRPKKGGASPAFTARIERPLFHRGGSASKKDGWLLPDPPCMFVFLMREEYSSYPLHYYEYKY